MRILLLLFVFCSSSTAYAQIRAFDNSKAIMPWIYNPAADFSDNLQAYAGFDGRGKSSFTPQSFLAGIRMPIPGLGGRKPMGKGPKGVAGVQVLNTSQNLIHTLNIHLNYAHQIPLNASLKLGFGLGAGITNISFEYGDLVFLDPQDQLLQQADRLYNLHLNSGLSLVANDRLFIYLAAPDLLKNGGANVKEIILRTGYILEMGSDYKLTTAANVDTYNQNVIFGGDVQFEWKETISFLAGADRYKYHGGVLLDLKAFAFGYTYGLNSNRIFNHYESHQISARLSFLNFGNSSRR